MHKNLILQRFSSQLLYPLASTIIGHRPFSRFIRSKRAISRREKKRGEISPIIVMIMVKMIGENGIRRWLTSWHRYKRPDENFLLRSHRSIAHASRRYFFTDDPLHRQRSPVFSPWTVRQVQVTHFDRDSPRVAFERFRKIREKEFDRRPSSRSKSLNKSKFQNFSLNRAKIKFDFSSQEDSVEKQREIKKKPCSPQRIAFPADRSKIRRLPLLSSSVALSSVADYRGKIGRFSPSHVGNRESRPRWFRWFLVTLWHWSDVNPARLYAKCTRAVARETRGNARPREPTALHKIYLALVQRVVVRSFFWRTFRDATPSSG